MGSWWNLVGTFASHASVMVSVTPRLSNSLLAIQLDYELVTNPINLVGGTSVRSGSICWCVIRTQTCTSTGQLGHTGSLIICLYVWN